MKHLFRQHFIPLYILATWCASGCNFVVLEGKSVPPPGSIADVDSSCEHITISRGVALAIECSNQNEPCAAMSVDSENPSIAETLAAYSDDLHRDVGSYGPRQPPTTFVIIAKQVGETDLTVRTSDGTVTYQVLVGE